MNQNMRTLIFSVTILFFLEAHAQVEWISRGFEYPTTATEAIAGSSSQIIAVGSSGKYLTSEDGKSWTQRVMDSKDKLHAIVWTTIKSLEPTPDLYSIGFSKTQNIAVGKDGTILGSSDGITWTPKSS